MVETFKSFASFGVFCALVVLIVLNVYSDIHSQADRDAKDKAMTEARGVIVTQRNAEMLAVESKLEEIKKHTENRYTSIDAANDKAEIYRRIDALSATKKP